MDQKIDWPVLLNAGKNIATIIICVIGIVVLIAWMVPRPTESTTMLTDERLASISNAARQQCEVFGAQRNSPAMSQCVGIFLAGWLERDRLK